MHLMRWREAFFRDFGEKYFQVVLINVFFKRGLLSVAYPNKGIRIEGTFLKFFFLFLKAISSIIYFTTAIQ